MSNLDLFPPLTITYMDAANLRVIIEVAEKLEGEIKILGYPTEKEMQAWICFDVGERRFAIWRATGFLYDVDEYGAAADDPIEVSDL